MSPTKAPLPERTVADIMRRDVVELTPDTPAREAARTLWLRGITGAPVVEGGRPVGVVSASDLLGVLAAGPGEGEEEGEVEAARAGPAVRDLMMPATFSIHPHATIPELARFLLRAGVHRALVVEEGRLAGIVTTTDGLRAVAGEWRKPSDRA